jgi:hypothetical protein
MHKKTVKLLFFALYGIAHVKAASRMFMKLNPDDVRRNDSKHLHVIKSELLESNWIIVQPRLRVVQTKPLRMSEKLFRGQTEQTDFSEYF